MSTRHTDLDGSAYLVAYTVCALWVATAIVIAMTWPR